MSHAILMTSNMAGTKLPSKLVSIKLGADVDNGNVVAFTTLADGEQEAFDSATPAANTALASIALISAPEVMYDENKKNLNEFYCESGSIVRGYMLCSGDEFGLTADGFTGTPAVGNFVELQAGYKLKTVSSATASTTQVGKIIAKNGDYFIVRVA